MGNRSRIGRVPLHPFHSAKWLHTYQHYKMDTYYKVDGIWTSCFLHNGMLCNNPWTKNTTTWIMRFIPYKMDVLRTHKHSNQIIKQHFLLPFRWMLVGFLPNSILTTLVISRWILPMNNGSEYLASPTAKNHETLANKGIYRYFETAWYWLQMHGPTVQRSSLEAHHSVEKILTADQFAMVLCGCHTHTHSKTLGWIWYDLIGSCKGFLLTRQLGWNSKQLCHRLSAEVSNTKKSVTWCKPRLVRSYCHT